MHNELQAEIQVTHSFNDDPETFGTQCPIFALITFTYVKFFSFEFLIPLFGCVFSRDKYSTNSLVT